MAATYILIASNVLTSTTVNVTFSSIPSTYTDLILKLSTRSVDAATSNIYSKIVLNGDTSAIYSNKRMQGNGATGSGASQSGLAYMHGGQNDSSLATSNTFANNEIYIPSYTNSFNRIISVSSAQENNSTTAYILGNSGLYQSSTAVSSITITDPSGSGWAAGSSFYLYGVKNS